MASIGSLSVSDLINYTIPYQIAALSIGLLVGFILLLDHADILLRSWHVRGLYRVTSETLFKTRFRKKLSGAELENALRYAYNNYTKQGKPFATKADLESWIILLPPKAMKEWCNLPYSHLNFTRYLQDVVAMGYHTQVDCQTHLRAVAAYNQKKHFEKIQRDMAADTEEFLPSLLGNPNQKEWTDFNLIGTASPLLMFFSTSLVLGPRFSRDQELMAQITSHVLGIEEVLGEFDRYPRIIRPLVWGLSPTCRAFRSNASILKGKLIPEIRRRVELIRSGESAADDLTMLTIFLKQALKDGLLSREESPNDEKQFESLSMKSLFHIYEVWGPIALFLIALLSRIMDSPEYVEDLREEVSKALASAGGWDSDFLANTPKLESFTRETLRLNVAIAVSVSRVLHAPLKLKSVDIDLPKGSYIGVPSKFMHTDPELYPDPLTFDRYRFYDQASNTSTARATTASETFLPFGYGVSLCPGRFIGVKAAQVAFSRFLLEYEVQFPCKGQKFAPMALIENTWTYPEMDVMAKVRRRQPKSA
ncbi:putative Cytochrome P450 monooxygenase [Trichophyton interdigitale]|uniref:Cytochrome P450 monooxygenase n=2 Tax=Trichophyton interdigitale TaxID=101480 RepID=A0A9P4YG97_9EURO|nr:hypothetical protein H101_01712 [Trichophyton interdigitale H6]KAF3893439.1 putative Cytochrome P450 monooxygenase [Trichophyton interdigitale]KAF3895300.1 putative Cytochrome P450 monooxygenase [Trichophyton interdigitale]KAG8208689.1 putative Cytochrome P450 monooxygenase [Trichophyton interdigitale]KDB21332.1 hypothetical protein H109_06739 [Trichophyton interdigitale MR816]